MKGSGCGYTSLQSTVKGIEIGLDERFLDEANFRDLLAIFKRYELDFSPLRQLITPEHESWIMNPHAFWYDKLLGSPR